MLRVSDTRLFCFSNFATPEMFLPSDLFFIEYLRIEHALFTIGLLYVKFIFWTRIFHRGVPDFAADCHLSVWYRGLTTCLMYVNPVLGNLCLNCICLYSSIIENTFFIIFISCVCIYIHIYINIIFDDVFICLIVTSQVLPNAHVLTFSIEVAFAFSIEIVFLQQIFTITLRWKSVLSCLSGEQFNISDCIFLSWGLIKVQKTINWELIQIRQCKKYLFVWDKRIQPHVEAGVVFNAILP